MSRCDHEAATTAQICAHLHAQATPFGDYHPSTKLFVTRSTGALIASRLGGHDATASWNVGCPDAEMLAHCRQPGAHAGRCWVVDRLALPR